MRPIELIVIHCSDTDYPLQTAAWINEIHITERHFNSIGYHYFIRHSGLIEQGRLLHIVGAHAKNHNQKSIGICLAGKLHFTPSQYHSLTLLLNTLRFSFQTAKVVAHNHLNPDKTCPNFDVSRFARLYHPAS